MNKDNISEYVSVQVTFGEVDVAENDSTHSGEYYLTCLATISVIPQGSYSFSGASVSCVLEKAAGLIHKGGNWYPLKVNESPSYILRDQWTGNIPFDKEGYGKTTVVLFCYSDTYHNTHPSAGSWRCYASDATGQVTEN